MDSVGKRKAPIVVVPASAKQDLSKPLKQKRTKTLITPETITEESRGAIRAVTSVNKDENSEANIGIASEPAGIETHSTHDCPIPELNASTSTTDVASGNFEIGRFAQYHREYAERYAGPLFEGQLFGLNYEPLLQGPVVIPFRKTIKIVSGTSSLQGNLIRHLVSEIPQIDDGPQQSRFTWIDYSLKQTRWTVQGPATALQVLQALSRNIRDSVAKHFVRSQVLIDSVRNSVPSQGAETWRGGIVPYHQQIAYMRPSDTTYTNKDPPYLFLIPDPSDHLNEPQLADAAAQAIRLYARDPSFGPSTVQRSLHSFQGFRMIGENVFEALWSAD